MVPVTDYDKTSPELEMRDYLHSGESEIHISNQKQQHVLFRIDKAHQLCQYHGGIAFLMYEFHEDKTYFGKGFNAIGTQNILKRVRHYDVSGRLKGSAEFEDIARAEFEIRDLQKFEEVMNKIDEQDGNYDPEDASEKNIIKHDFNTAGKLIRSEPISTKDFWEYQNFMGRP